MRRLLIRTYRLIRYPDRLERIRTTYRAWQVERHDRLAHEEVSAYAIQLRSYPVKLMLDPATMCNLACPFCPTGNGSAEIKKELLTRETFYKIVSRLNTIVIKDVLLYNWGEPLLNRDLPEFIRYFHDRCIPTTTSVNFVVKDYDDAFLERLVESGLDTLLVSADGASQETYGRYRVKGDFERLIRNMKQINRVKQKMGKDNPKVYYKMLLNKFNEPEVEKARALAEECGAEFLLQEHFYMPEHLRDEWMADSLKQKYRDLPAGSFEQREDGTMHTICRQLWDTVLINANGDVYPCCIVSKPSQRVGNLLEQDFKTIWNNEKMQTLRRYVTDPNAAAPSFDSPCGHCLHRYCTHGQPPAAAAPSKQEASIPG